MTEATEGTGPPHWVQEVGRVVLTTLGGMAISIGVLDLTKPVKPTWLGVALIPVGVVLALTPKAVESLSSRGRDGTASMFEAVAAVLGAVSLAGVVIVLIAAHGSKPDYGSAFDGLDPVRERCSPKATRVPGIAAPAVRDQDGRVIASLHLIHSPYCDTMWPQVLLTKQGAKRVRGRVLELRVTRKADDHVAIYRLPLRGGRAGFGNMIASNGSCVFASAQILALAPAHAGPVAQSACGTVP